ncbi:hypothetical protein Tco_1385574 [Tanacetum coccineum]
MESSNSNLKERELQLTQRLAKQRHSNCMTWFEQLETHLHDLYLLNSPYAVDAFKPAFRSFFGEEHQTFKLKMFHNLDQLRLQLERENLHGVNAKTCLQALRTQFKEFLASKGVNATDLLNQGWQQDFEDFTRCEPSAYRRELLENLDTLEAVIHRVVNTYGVLRMKENELNALKENGSQLHDEILHEHQIKSSVKMQSQDIQINPVQAMDDSLITKPDKQNTSSSSGSYTTQAVDADIRPVNDDEPFAKSVEMADLKAQLQEKVFANAALKNELRKIKGNSVDTKFAKASILGKPPLQPSRNHLVVRQPNAFTSERPRISRHESAAASTPHPGENSESNVINTVKLGPQCIRKGYLILDLQKLQKNPIFRISVDIRQNTNFVRAFTTSANVPSIYIQLFWNTLTHDITEAEEEAVQEKVHATHSKNLSGPRTLKPMQEDQTVIKLWKITLSSDSNVNSSMIADPSQMSHLAKSSSLRFNREILCAAWPRVHQESKNLKRVQRRLSESKGNKNKTANRNPANYHLYHALMEALIADEDAMDKEVAVKEVPDESTVISRASSEGTRSKPGVPDSDYFKDKMLLMNAHENGVVLDEEQLLFLAGEQVTNFDEDVDDLALNVDHVFEADQCDAFDSDVDEAPTTQTMFMANLSSEDPIYDEAGPSYDSNTPFEVQDHDTFVDHMDEYHEVHEMQSDVQHNYVVDSDADYTSDSNIIPYDQYVEDNEEHVVQSNVSSVRNDALMSILDEMHEQGVQSMSANKQVKVVNDTLTSELARYKELVGVYEQRAKFELTDRERKIDEQMRIIISDRNRKETSLKSELHSAQLQLRSTLNHHKIMREEAIILKKDFKQKEDKFLEEFLDIKRLKEKVEDRLYKQDQSVQTQVQPALYNGHVLVMSNHARPVVHDLEDTHEISEDNSGKKHEKMKSPLCVENKIRDRIAPPDYSKENLLATFAPQRNLTPEQIFWSIDNNDRKKAETSVPKPLSALTVYPPNTPVKLVPRVLPTKSQVKINLYVLTQLFTEFDKTCKKRITPTGVTEGERGGIDHPLESGLRLFKTRFRGMVGSLMYLTASRRDLVFVVCMCARYQAKPTKKHLEANSNLMQMRGSCGMSGFLAKKYVGKCFSFFGDRWLVVIQRSKEAWHLNNRGDYIAYVGCCAQDPLVEISAKDSRLYMFNKFLCTVTRSYDLPDRKGLPRDNPLVSTEVLKIKGVMKEALHTLRQKPGNTIAVRITTLIADIGKRSWTSDTKVIHYEMELCRAIHQKQALGSFRDGDGDTQFQ